MTSSTVEVSQEAIADITALPVSEEMKQLILEALKNGVKMTVDRVI